MKDDFRRPKTPVGPKIVRWTKNGDWPFPRFEVFADIIHAWQMCDGIVPEARVALTNAVTFITAKVSTDRKVAALTEE